jgi:DNA ligase D-like protein (predicted ligase)
VLPNSIKPMLATLGKPFDSPEFRYEIKWDGYRCLTFLDGATRLQSRNLKDISAVFPELDRLHQRVKSQGTVLDGEIIALRDGRPSFGELQKRAQLRNEEQIRATAAKIPAVLVVFDLLYHNNQPVLDEPLEQRRARLADLLLPAEELILSEQVPEHGIAYFQSVSKLGMEGVIAKRNDSPYLPGKRVMSWLKFKRKQIGNFLVCGYTIKPTRRGELSSLILGAFEDERLQWRGLVGTGFTVRELQEIHQELRSIETPECPFTGTALKPKGVHWTRPIIPCEVEFLELTDDGSLRHPSFRRFRPDLTPGECRLEEV